MLPSSGKMEKGSKMRNAKMRKSGGNKSGIVADHAKRILNRGFDVFIRLALYMEGQMRARVNISKRTQRAGGSGANLGVGVAQHRNQAVKAVVRSDFSDTGDGAQANLLVLIAGEAIRPFSFFFSMSF